MADWGAVKKKRAWWYRMTKTTPPREERYAPGDQVWDYNLCPVFFTVEDRGVKGKPELWAVPDDSALASFRLIG